MYNVPGWDAYCICDIENENWGNEKVSLFIADYPPYISLSLAVSMSLTYNHMTSQTSISQVSPLPFRRDQYAEAL